MAIDRREKKRINLRPGTVLQNRYRIVREIDEGGTAIIYLAERIGIDEEARLAIKELDPELFSVDEFKNEVNLLYKLNHPNLPKIYDFFFEDGRYYLVMDYIDGHTLDTVMVERGGSIPAADVYDYALQICDIFIYLHSLKHRIIHRDLKPANLILSRDGRIKLVDFGIARVHKPGRPADTLFAYTESVAPPEQKENRASDERSDIYSFGATLCYLITGRPPSRRYLSSETREADGRIPHTLDLLIRKCLEYNPDDRYQSFTEIKAVLTSELPRREPTLIPTARHRARRLIPLILGCIVLAAAGLGVYWVVFSQGGPDKVLPVQAARWTMAYGETATFEVHANEQGELQWALMDVQRGHRVRVLKGNPVSLQAPLPGMYRFEVYRESDGKLIAQSSEIICYSSFHLDSKVVLGHTAFLQAEPEFVADGRTIAYQWDITKPDKTKLSVALREHEFVFNQEGAYTIRLTTVIASGDGSGRISLPGPERPLEVVKSVKVNPARIINKNPSFEAELAGLPSGWIVADGSGVSFDRVEAQDGSKSVRLDGHYPVESYPIWQACQIQSGHRYRLTLWVKGQGITGGVQAVEVRFRSKTSDAYVYPDQRAQEKWSGDFDWRQIMVEFDLPASVDANAEIYLMFKGKGTVWFDNVVLERL